MKSAFNNENYLSEQSKHILKRIDNAGDRLYLEFGGKLFDDFHASRVLPGFMPTSKIDLIRRMQAQVEIIVCINAHDIEKHKIRADFGITYDIEVFRLIDHLRSISIDVNSVVITQFTGQAAAESFKTKLERRDIRTYIHRPTKGYPTDVDVIVSEEGYGANPYIETTKPLVIVTSPGAGGGKLATCLSQLYHESKRRIRSSYAKYETFPIWNLPLDHPVNIAYEAATADLNDINMIDSFHLSAYGETAVNYNRDLAVFPVLKSILERITGECVYKSPTDMGVNMTGFCIEDEEAVSEASRQEVLRRYYKSFCEFKRGESGEEAVGRIKVLMSQLNITPECRAPVAPCLQKTLESKCPVVAIQLPTGDIITGKDNKLMTAAASALLNAIKTMANISDEIHLLSPMVLEPMLKIKGEFAGGTSLLTVYDVLMCLSICAVTNPAIGLALEQLPKLSYCDAHAGYMIPAADENMYRTLNIWLTCEPGFFTENLYFDV